MFVFNDTATTEIYTLSLHDALPICALLGGVVPSTLGGLDFALTGLFIVLAIEACRAGSSNSEDRKRTRLNSSHANISYAVFCLKKTPARPAASSPCRRTLPRTATIP